MKRLFNRTKKSHKEWDSYDADDYEVEDLDWDEPETYGNEDDTYSTDSGELVCSEETCEYYAEEAEGEAYYAEESGEYYAETEPGGEEYHAEESGEYYAEAEPGDEAYYMEKIGEFNTDTEHTESYNVDVYSEEFYIEPNPDTEKYNFAEIEDLEEEEYNETYSLWYNDKAKTGKKGAFARLWEGFLKMGVMDKMITATGIAVLILAIAAGGAYLSNRATDKQLSELVSVGSQLEGIDLIGEQGLLAVADAELARLAAAEIVEEEQKEYDEEEYSHSVTIKLNMTSVMKDLKIKFTNKETGKLIGNVPFSVTITGPDGKSETWSDDDMDGIIYRKEIQPGTYEVLVNELAGEKYEDYTIPTVAQTVEVKKEIAYEKVDVSDEVKSESEVDVSKEDTKINETVVESTLQDTVTWVESTAVSETYTEVSKSTIPDPATLVMTAGEEYPLLASNLLPSVSSGDAGIGNDGIHVATITPATANMAAGDTMSAKVSATGYKAGSTLNYSVISSNENVATATVDATGNITIKSIAVGTATITATVNYAEGESAPATAALQLAVVEGQKLTLNKSEVTVYLTEAVTINAIVRGGTEQTVVAAESSNKEVAIVSVNGTTITVTGVTEGEATITVKYVENNEEVQATCVVKVKPTPKDNKTDKLKDINGNQLYVIENGAYREAVYADYYTAEKFFIKGEQKYTGWQTIDGNLYYFTSAGEKVTGEQIIQGAKYNFASDGSLITGNGTLGIDVSKWNGKIDWTAVKNSGVSYVIIRCGYRGSSAGKIIEDPKFDENIKGAIAAGLKVGVYFFTQATDEIEAVEEASFVLDQIKNYRISYPVFLDVEPSGGRGDKISKTTRTAVCKAFCETIQRSGYTAGIYANRTWLNEKISTGDLGAYKIWLAQYAATPTYTGRYDMWQYKATGKVSGISGDVDMNISYLGY